MKRMVAMVVMGAMMACFAFVGCTNKEPIDLSSEEALGILLVNGMVDFLAQDLWEMDRLSIKELSVVKSEQLQSSYYFKVGLERMTVKGKVDDCIYFSISGFDPLYIKLDPLDDVAEDKKRNQIQFESIENKMKIDLEVIMDNLDVDKALLLDTLVVNRVEYYYHGQMIKFVES